MTLPVTLADTPALPRAAEPAAVGPAAIGGGAAFAETLAGAMGPVTPRETATGAAKDGAQDGTAPQGADPTDAEAMLADMEQRAVAVEGEAVAATLAMPTVPGTETVTADPAVAVEGVVGPISDVPIADGSSEAGDPAGPETPGEIEVVAGEDAASEEKPAEEEIPLTLPITALLAAALPAATGPEGAAPPVQPSDASVEAARRAMAATMAVPGLVKPEKAAKGPLDGPEAAEPMPEGEAVTAEEAEIGPAKGPATPELRAVAPQAAPAVADPRNGAETRREAVSEITLAGVEGEAVQTAPTTTSGSGLAAQAGAQAMLPGAGGPIQTTRPGWEAALADRISAELSGDGKEIELDLAPETLGHLKIRLEVVDGLAQVRIVTETAEAARLFQQSEHRLSESLSRAGLSLGGQDTTSRDAQSGAGQGQSGQGQSAQGQAGTGPGDRGSRPRGMEIHFDRQGPAGLPEMAGRAGRGLVNLIA